MAPAFLEVNGVAKANWTSPGDSAFSNTITINGYTATRNISTGAFELTSPVSCIVETIDYPANNGAPTYRTQQLSANTMTRLTCTGRALEFMIY